MEKGKNMIKHTAMGILTKDKLFDLVQNKKNLVINCVS